MSEQFCVKVIFVTLNCEREVGRALSHRTFKEITVGKNNRENTLSRKLYKTRLAIVKVTQSFSLVVSLLAVGEHGSTEKR